MADKWPVYQGLDCDFTVTLKRTDGTALTDVYAGTETFTLRIWPGGQRDPITASNSTAAWNDADAATVDVHLDQLDTVSFPEGKLYCLLEMADGSDDVPAYQCELAVRNMPGTDDAPASYIDIDDLRAVYPDIEDLQEELSDETGFARQCGEAREWFDELLQRHWTMGQDGPRQDRLTWPVTARIYTGNDPWLKEQLENDRIILTSKIKRANAYYAAYLILENAIGSRGETSYQKLAAQYNERATTLAQTLTVELDTNAVESTATGTPTTTSVIGTAADLSSTNDFYNGWYLRITSGALAGTERLITDYVGSTATFTTAAFPSAPATGVTIQVRDNIGDTTIDLGHVEVLRG